MQIAEEYLQLVEQIAAAMPLPPIKRLHINTGDGDDCKSSKFGALELVDGTMGLTYIDLGEARTELQSRIRPDSYAGMSPQQLAQLYAGNEDWQHVLGMAAVNAISMSLVKTSGFQLTETTKSMSVLEPKLGDHVGMVGFFPPLVEHLREAEIRLTVIELNPEWLQEEGEFRVTDDPSALAGCNKVVCTGTTLINHTLENVLLHTKNAEQITLVGPTIGCLPDPLFRRGVTAIGGRQVLDHAQFLTLWNSGQPWRDSALRYELTANTYPGVEALLNRSAELR